MKLSINNSELVDITVKGFNWKLINDMRDETHPLFIMEYSDTVGFSYAMVELGSSYLLKDNDIDLELVLKNYSMVSGNLTQGAYSGNYRVEAGMKVERRYNWAQTIKSSELMRNYSVKGTSSDKDTTYSSENKTTYEMLKTVLESVNKDSWFHRNGNGEYQLSKLKTQGLVVTMKDQTTGLATGGFYLKNRLIQGKANVVSFSVWDGSLSNEFNNSEFSIGSLETVVTTKESYKPQETINYLERISKLSNNETIEILTPTYVATGSTVTLTLIIPASRGYEVTSTTKLVIRSEYVYKGIDTQGDLFCRLILI